MTTLLRDLRHAVQVLAKSRGFTVVVVLTLALGIGANTAIFSLVNAFLLRSLPVRDPERLVLFRTMNGANGRMSRGSDGYGYTDPVTGRKGKTSFSLLIFERFRAYHPALSEVFAFSPFDDVNILVEGRPEIAPSAQMVSGTYHIGLGVSAVLGRTFTAEDDRPSAPPVAVISHRYWQRRFDRDPTVLGKTISLNQVPTTIVGVTPAGFDGAMQVGESPDVSVPLAHHLRYQPGRADRAQPWYWWIRIMGRLAPGATAPQAKAVLEPVFQETAREGWLAGQSLDTTPLATPDAPTLAVDSGARGENNTRRQYEKSLHVLMGLAGLALVAACANVANLLLARGVKRRREVGVRLALGASRARIVGELLAESLLLALLGAVLGTLLAQWSRGLLLALRPFGAESIVLDLPLDTQVLAFTIAVAVATALLFGLAPAVRATRVDVTAEFQGGTRALGGGARSRLSQALMVGQIALSLVLLVSTGLFVRTLRNLQGVDTGFNRRGLVLFRLDAGAAGYKRPQLANLYARLQGSIERLPGVSAATFSGYPLLSRNMQGNGISVPGRSPLGGSSDHRNNVHMNSVAPNYFIAMELPLVLGRGFTDRDDIAAPRVGIINQALAEKYFGRDYPVGRQLDITSGPRGTVEIIGVARDAKYTDLRSPMPPTLYLPTFQQLSGRVHFHVRTGGDPTVLFAAIRAAVRDIDPSLPVLDLRTLDEQIDRLNAQELLFARLSGVFGALALTLACVGLYGLLSFQLLRRTGEIGLRAALGAMPEHILGMVLRETFALASLGIVLGLAVSYVASRLVASMLFGLSPADPLTYAIVAIILMAVALAASLLPARRATRIGPTEALRCE